MTTQKSKAAFSLAELSVVVVISSIMFSTVLVSRSLIQSVKINKTMEEYRMFSNSLNIFTDQYGCVPGDCPLEKIRDIADRMPSACTTQNLTAGPSFLRFSTGMIDSTLKRTCAMYSLQLGGFINKSVDPTYATLTDSIAGKNIPYAKTLKTSAWDLRFYIKGGFFDDTKGYAGGRSVPYEVSMVPGFTDTHAVVLRGASVKSGNNLDILLYGTTIPTVPYGTSPSFAARMDAKFDDAKPYSGKITGGSNAAAWNNGSGPNNDCTTMVVSSAATDIAAGTISYLGGNNVARGCLLAFAVDLSR